ncbi:MAG: hypothetical protein K0S27_1415 [Gammaproteobacteria bacterium]|jgi:hypothetical protein|nr:hypothetical protein [Gammaproteobacteria bacterium]
MIQHHCKNDSIKMNSIYILALEDNDLAFISWWVVSLSAPNIEDIKWG